MIHHVSKLALALTVATFASTGCPRPVDEPQADKTEKPRGDAKPTEPVADKPEPVADKPEPVADKPAPAGPIVYFVGAQLWRMEADGSQARALGLEPQRRTGDEASTPTVSADGRRVAWTDGTDLWVAELGADEPDRKQITTMPTQQRGIAAAEFGFSTWSPDSSTIVVTLSEPAYGEQDPLPLPTGLQYGIYTLRTDDLTLVHAPHIADVYGWMPDSKAVIDNSKVSDAEYQLLAHPIDPGPSKLLRTSHDQFGFAQLRVTGEWLAWSGNNQVFVVPLTGGDPKPMSPQDPSGEIQWPFVAPDGMHVIFEWKGNVHLSAGPNEADGKPLPANTQRRWLDAEHLLAITADGLVSIDLDGNTKVLDAKGTGLPRQ